LKKNDEFYIKIVHLKWYFYIKLIIII
jgi:hypothetical protein